MLRGVVVDVIANLERQVQAHLVDRHDRLCRYLPGRQLGDGLPHLHPTVVTLGHERVESLGSEHLVAER